MSGPADALLDQIEAAQSQGSPAPAPRGAPAFTDTGQPGTAAQQQAYVHGYSSGAFDSNAPVGSAKNPYGLRSGDRPRPDAWFVDLDGQLKPPGASPLSVDHLLDQVANSNPGMSTGEDVGRSFVTGLEKGAIDGPLGATGAASSGMLSHLRGAGAPVDAIEQRISKDPLGLLATVLAETSPGPSLIGKLRQSLTGPDHDPQTVAGHYALTAGEFAPAAALPVEGGALAQVLARGSRIALPAAASETAGQITATPQHPEGNPWARLAGAALGGVPTELGLTVANAPQALLAKGLEGVSPSHISAATDLQNTALGMGVHLTPAEALDQVTGGATGVNRLQHFVENSRVGAPVVAPMMAQRSGQVSGAVNSLADLLAPKSDQPGMIGVAAQKAAQGGLDNVRKGINAVATPAYDALREQAIPDAEYQTVAGKAAYREALANVRGNPLLNEDIAHLPDNNLAVVNEVQKELNRSASARAQTQLNPNGNNQESAKYSGVASTADELARALSGDWRDAHDIVSGGRATYLDPLDAGPAGKIAATTDLPAQTGALYPAKPPEGAANETAQALRLMGAQDPQVGADLTRQHLMTNFNEANQGLVGGDNQWGGAKFAAQIAGNPEQRATLAAGLGVVNPEAAKGLDPLLEVLQATGKRLPVGSRTTFNQEARDSFGMAPLPIRSMGALLDPLEIGKHLDNAVGGAMYRRNITVLADLLANSSPEEADAYLRGAANKRAPLPLAIPTEAATGSRKP